MLLKNSNRARVLAHVSILYIQKYVLGLVYTSRYGRI